MTPTVQLKLFSELSLACLDCGAPVSSLAQLREACDKSTNPNGTHRVEPREYFDLFRVSGG
jgi:hypothetical protein